jgi:hypothetical protein
MGPIVGLDYLASGIHIESGASLDYIHLAACSSLVELKRRPWRY